MKSQAIKLITKRPPGNPKPVQQISWKSVQHLQRCSNNIVALEEKLQDQQSVKTHSRIKIQNHLELSDNREMEACLCNTQNRKTPCRFDDVVSVVSKKRNNGFWHPW